MFKKTPGQEVRNLVIDLVVIAERASNLTCASCGITLFGTPEELELLQHKPRCVFRRASKYLEATA